MSGEGRQLLPNGGGRNNLLSLAHGVLLDIKREANTFRVHLRVFFDDDLVNHVVLLETDFSFPITLSTVNKSFR